MKKEIQSKNKNRNMSTNSVPKRMQSILSALTDFVVDVVGDNDNEDTVRQAMVDHQDELVTLLKDNMPVQKTTSLKKVKDPDAPKRGKSSYIYFCVEKRDEIKKANPDMSAKEIIKELGRVWREDVPDKDKARYTKLSDADKARYEEEMKDYTPPPGVDKVVEKKSKRAGPKRALTSYIFFCKDQRAVLKDEKSKLSTKELTAELGKRWRELSEKDRKPYEKLATKDKDRYEKEKSDWVDPEGDEDAPKKKTKAKKAPSKKKTKAKKAPSKKKTKAKKAPSKPRRKSGYIVYCQEIRPGLKEEHEDWTSQQVTKELGRTWSELSEQEQNEYNERANDPDESAPAPAKVSKKKGKSSKKGKSLPEPESDLEELDDELTDESE
jgi:hypothetical protein